MTPSSTSSVLSRTKGPFQAIAEQEGLLGVDVSVVATPISPEEAIGTPGRRDFPILLGKERVVEARVRDSRGHAFTDSAQEFLGSVRDILSLDLDTNQRRAVYVATLNAVFAHLGRVDATVHCRHDEPEECARRIAQHLYERYGKVDVGLVGLNPAIAERLAEVFGREHLRITDLNPANVGQTRFGVDVWDGAARMDDLIDRSSVVLVTGTTLVNGTFDAVDQRCRDRDRSLIVYGVTAAAVSTLVPFERICPCGHDGRAKVVSIG